ncbi:MAG: transposase, partial [Deltaproteobacteria bacterium]|nr:transposase [Deltaproteobacteria bacterium]
MARLSRYFVPGQPQHLIQRGNNREPIFAQDADYQFYVECLLDATRRHDMVIHAYVLMTNHVHLLATPGNEQSIPKTLQSVGRRYVQYFNHRCKRTGTLWEGRYKATLIDSENYLLKCMRYIELNPVRAGMVGRPSEYQWSSYRRNALGQEDVLVQPHFIYQELGRTESDRENDYAQLFDSLLSEGDICMIREATNKSWVLGNDRFREKIEMLSGRRASPRPRGKSKKPDKLFANNPS